MRTTSWAIAAVAMGSWAIGAWTVACSSSDPRAENSTASSARDGGSPSSASSSGSSGKGGTSGSSGGFDAGGPDPDLTCYSQTSDACESCCEKNHPTGSDQWNTAYLGCLCTPDKCQAACAQTDCNDADDAGASTPGDACDLCNKKYAPDDGGGACGAVISAACTSADCMAYSNCTDNCP